MHGADGKRHWTEFKKPGNLSTLSLPQLPWPLKLKTVSLRFADYFCPKWILLWAVVALSLSYYDKEERGRKFAKLREKIKFYQKDRTPAFTFKQRTVWIFIQHKYIARILSYT